ncbi:MAG: DUF2188 domain-containing protein [Actinobacteria bacterium]|nr:DUF2188 domain-containing protein [Actinomycetota bacterium]
MNQAETTMVVRVDIDPRGGWQVRLPGQRPIRCATREEAERAARRGCAEARRASEILVRDAYGRVMDRRTLAGGRAGLEP